MKCIACCEQHQAALLLTFGVLVGKAWQRSVGARVDCCRHVYSVVLLAP